MDYRRMYDSSDMLYAYDLEDEGGRDVVLQIEKVWAGELTGEKGRKSKKPFVKFVGRDKKLALNKTNGKAIAKMYGKDAEQWPGKWVALFTTTTEMDGEVKDCIRVRPNRPETQRPAANGRPRKAFDVESVIAAFGGCDDAEMFAALEADRKAAWASIGKDDKLRVKAAAEQAHTRVLDAAHDAATKAATIGVDEAAEAEAQS